MLPVVNFKKQAVLLLPPDKRTPTNVALAKAIASALVYKYGLFMDYINGSDYLNYHSSVTYAAGQRVIYQYAVYECIVGTTGGAFPAIDDTHWMQVNSSFVGANERSLYSSGKINLEWALNRYFQTTFRQPNFAGTSLSDIYITTNEIVNGSFIIESAEPGSSDVFSNVSNGYVFSTEQFVEQSTYLFTVHVPIVVYTAIANPQQTISKFLNPLITVGTTYIIVTY